MRHLKILIIILCLGGYVFINLPAYCFYRDDLDHSAIIKEVEKQRQENKARFEEKQKKKQAEQREEIEKPELIVQPKRPEQTKAGSRSSAVLFYFVLAFTGGLLGYILYLYKKK